MREIRALEAATTKYIIITVLLTIGITVGSFAIIVACNLINIDTLSSFVDAVLKTVALLVGTIWALNRYFSGRIDVTKLRVMNSNVKLIKDINADSNLALLIFRFDILNDSTSQIPEFNQCLMVEAIYPTNEGTKYEQIYRWPSAGMHIGGPIEPNSWAAINDAVTITKSINVVRIYLKIQIAEEQIWTWHQNFDISKSEVND